MNKPQITRNAYSRNIQYVEYVPVEVLEKYAEFDRAGKDAFEHSETTIKELSENLLDAITEPLIIEYFRYENKALLIEGNHRLKAAILAKIENLPTVVITAKRNAPSKAKPVAGMLPNEHGYIPSMVKPSQIGLPALPVMPSDIKDSIYAAKGSYLKQIKTGIDAAVEDVIELPRYSKIGKMEGVMLYNKFKDIPREQYENGTLPDNDMPQVEEYKPMEYAVFKKLEDKGILYLAGYPGLSKTYIIYDSNNLAFDFVQAVKARQNTLKSVKKDEDMFPFMANIPEMDLLKKEIDIENKFEEAARILSQEIESILIDAKQNKENDKLGVGTKEESLLKNPTPNQILENIDAYSKNQLISILKLNDRNGDYDTSSYEDARQMVIDLFNSDEFSVLDRQSKLKWLVLPIDKEAKVISFKNKVDDNTIAKIKEFSGINIVEGETFTDINGEAYRIEKINENGDIEIVSLNNNEYNLYNGKNTINLDNKNVFSIFYKSLPNSEGEVVQANVSETKSALKDVESTAKALENERWKHFPVKKINYEKIDSDLGITYFPKLGYKIDRTKLNKTLNELGFQIVTRGNKFIVSFKDTFTVDGGVDFISNSFIGEQDLGKNLSTFISGVIESLPARIKKESIFKSEAYHKAKADGSNPELVKAVEDLINITPHIDINPALTDVDFTAKGGNKVVDEKTGDPKIMYHETDADFSEFDNAMKGTGQGNDFGGIWFSEKASGYFAQPKKNKHTVKISIKNPANDADLKQAQLLLPDNLYKDKVGKSKWYTQHFKSKGFDGIILKNGEYAVFDKSQILPVTKFENGGNTNFKFKWEIDETGFKPNFIIDKEEQPDYFEKYGENDKHVYGVLYGYNVVDNSLGKYNVTWFSTNKEQQQQQYPEIIKDTANLTSDEYIGDLLALSDSKQIFVSDIDTAKKIANKIYETLQKTPESIPTVDDIIKEYSTPYVKVNKFENGGNIYDNNKVNHFKKLNNMLDESLSKNESIDIKSLPQLTTVLATKQKEFTYHLAKDFIQKVKHDKRSVDKLALDYGLVDAMGNLRLDVIKELIELAVVITARYYANYANNLSTQEVYSHITDLYRQQPTLSYRTSLSVLHQQYSTSIPLGYLCGLYTGVNKPNSNYDVYFEPTAGNGALTVAGDCKYFDVNEIDKLRLKNLLAQGFRNVTSIDASEPFPSEYKNKYDAVLCNPPFGTNDVVMQYKGLGIKKLEYIIAINALETMKNNGKAAIIMGSHMGYDSEGRVSKGQQREFFTFLFAFYNVEDIVNIDSSKLYARQGTAWDIKLILINGRKEKPQGYPPLENKQLDVTARMSSKVVHDWDTLYKRIMQ